MNNKSLSIEDSKCITLWKGISILMVLLIHTDLRPRIHSDIPLWFDVYGEIVNRILVMNAVPMFFFISGFLFYLKEEPIWVKWKKRITTLLIP